MRSKHIYKFYIIILILLFVSLSSCSKNISQPTLTTIKFGMLPYGDHTYAIIGEKQGWFKDVEIDFKYEAIKVEEIIPALKNNRLDVVSTPPGILFASYDNASNLCSFVFGDLFQGYAIMARPNMGIKSNADFLRNGLTEEDALKATVRQLKGKAFAYPTEAAIKPFIDLVLEKGKLDRKEFRSLVLDDPLTVNAMRNKQADFQVGGVPSRLVLQREGFIPIISSLDLAKLAKPSAESKELSSILQNGWATRKDYYKEQHQTILRLASVNFRIMKFMNTNKKEALAIHMPYLSQITGQSFSEQDGEIIYDYLDPFITFEGQKDWFHNKENPFYYAYVNGSILNSFIEQKIFNAAPPKVEDVIFADDIYYELEKLKENTELLFLKIEEGKLFGKSKVFLEKYEKAKFNYGIYNFYDSDRLAKEIIEAFSK